MSEPKARATRSPMEQITPFSLAPAIFLPFPGFPHNVESPTPLEPAEKLRKIIDNVTVQQERVRHNMISLVQQRAERLSTEAIKELSALGDDYESEEEEEKSKQQQSIDALLISLKAPAKQGARYEDFEYKIETNQDTPGTASMARTTTLSDGDVNMSGVDASFDKPSSPPHGDINISNSRSSSQILSSLSHDMRELVNSSASQMQSYDICAKEVLAHYKQALDRRAGGRVSVSSPIKPGDDGRRSSISSPVDTQNVRRMTSGMPIPGSSSGQQPVRVREGYDELIRRGSK